MADATEIAYFAGFFDGEGSIGIYPKKYVCSITNTDIRPLQRAAEIWGGKVYLNKKETRKCAVQDLWRWQIYGHSSRSFLEAIRPYTKIKSDQIDCFLTTLKYVPSKNGEKRSLGASAIIFDATEKLKKMKRGIS